MSSGKKKYKKYSLLLLFFLLTFVPLYTVVAADAAQEQKVANVSFELMDCQLSGKTIRCVAYATSGDKDRGLVLALRGSKMYDDSGNEYQPKSAHIANKETTKSNIPVNSLLISGVRTKLQLAFSNVSTNARAVSRLDFYGKLEGKPMMVTFRNVPITK